MLVASYRRIDLKFKFEAITSRQSMTEKETYLLSITDTSRPEVVGVGECAVFRGLGADDTPEYEAILASLCCNVSRLQLDAIAESSIKFGFETALRDLANGGRRLIFPNDWIDGHRGIPINGLVWMGDFDTMLGRINEKIEQGFRCIKLKIGGIDFQREVELLRYIRSAFDASSLELRLDANGSFSPREALHRLDELARWDIHSIEQPIRAGQWPTMHEIARKSPIDIALDEELIGNMNYDRRCWLLDAIMPQFIILKPSLHGGFETCDGWIDNATEREIGWWATSALESNIGLNAIAQWVASKDTTLPQGLGTGALYSNNIQSPLEVKGAALYYNPTIEWQSSI